MQILKVVLAVALAIAFPAAASAQNGIASLSEPGFSNVPVSKPIAIAQAKRIYEACSSILALIPRLSPAEEKWLHGELDAQRDMANLIQRPEFGKHSLYIHFEDCVVNSKLAVESQSEKERVIGWARLVSRFSTSFPSDLVRYSEQAGSKELPDMVKTFTRWERLVPYQIIDGIVLPYLIRSK